MNGGQASCIVPFPYAGMTQFRFQGLISARLSPDTPNGDEDTLPFDPPECEGLYSRLLRSWNSTE